MKLDTVHFLAPHIPEAVFSVFELTFAIITAALICGSFAERMKFESMLIFIGLWHVLIYCPIAHSNWHFDGFLYKLGVLDFAGGNVVHVASGCSGLMTAIVIGHRKGWKARQRDTHPPHNVLMTYMGMCMLWVGWFGFNAGSAMGANERAAYALYTTQIATSASSLSWLAVEWYLIKKPSVFGMINGAVAGLVCMTSSAGYVDMNGAFFIGLFGGVFCYFGSQLKYEILKIDDSLDCFGIHAVGGIVGGIMTGFFATKAVTGNATGQGVYYSSLSVGGRQLAIQLCGILFSVGWSCIVTFLLATALDRTIGLRVSAEREDYGLDATQDEAVVHRGELDTNGGIELNNQSSSTHQAFPAGDEFY